MQRRTLLPRIGGALLLAAALPLAAQPAYPSRPVTFIVPAGAGGGLDAFARFVAGGVAPMLQQPVVVDNRPGANGAIGAQAVARAAPDGHTVLIGDVGVISINPALYPKLPYDPREQLPAVTVAARLPLMLVTGTGNGRFRSLDELLRSAKKDTPSFGSTGVGNISHLSGEMFARRAGIPMVHVPYKGAPALLADVVSGTLDVAVTSVVSGAELVKAGRLRVLALTGSRRMA